MLSWPSTPKPLKSLAGSRLYLHFKSVPTPTEVGWSRLGIEEGQRRDCLRWHTMLAHQVAPLPPDEGDAGRLSI